MIWTKLMSLFKGKVRSVYEYSPSPLLPNHVFQSVYEIYSKEIPVTYERTKIYFKDEGHVNLDWVNYFSQQTGREHVPIVFVMHGMTGGSECRYMKIMARMSIDRGYTCLCFNSRGFGADSQMTSPIPFLGLDFHELEAALNKVQERYPSRPIHMVGMSLGGNYLLRYLIRNRNSSLARNIKSLSLVCPPFDVKYVIYNMNQGYQKYFIKYYIEVVVCRHEVMKYWWENNIINYDKMVASKNLKQFHEQTTQKIVGLPIDQIFQKFKVQDEQIQHFSFPTLHITAKDDQMVPIQSIPIESIRRNKNIKLCLTEKGAHMCWFQGWLPQRWYPKPIFQFIEDIESNRKVHQL